MRSSEEMGLALYRAGLCHDGAPVESANATTWDDLSEAEQECSVALANAALVYLLEHGRISAYLNHAQLDKLSAEYRAYRRSARERPVRNRVMNGALQ